VDQLGELGKDDFSSMHPGSLAKSLLDENRIKLSQPSHRNWNKKLERVV
jgi:hypothetical protein